MQSFKTKPRVNKPAPSANGLFHPNVSPSFDIASTPAPEALDTPNMPHAAYFVPNSHRSAGYSDADMELFMGSLSYPAGTNLQPTSTSDTSLDSNLPNTLRTQPERSQGSLPHSSPWPNSVRSTRFEKLDSMIVYNYHGLDEDEEELYNTKEWSKAQETIERLIQCQGDSNLVQGHSFCKSPTTNPPSFLTFISTSQTLCVLLGIVSIRQRHFVIW